MTRMRWPVLALVAVAGVSALGVTGCSAPAPIPGRAHASECARHDLDPQNCDEYVPVRPVAQELLLGADRAAAARMMCSLLDEATWQQLAGGGPIYRRIDPTGSGACVVAAAVAPDQPRFSITVSSYPEPMQGYSIVDGNERAVVAGHPAWRNTFNDSLGNRKTEYTVATGQDALSGGVVFVTVQAELPRGVFEAPQPPPVPAYERHAEIADTVITNLQRSA